MSDPEKKWTVYDKDYSKLDIIDLEEDAVWSLMFGVKLKGEQQTATEIIETWHPSCQYIVNDAVRHVEKGTKPVYVDTRREYMTRWSPAELQWRLEQAKKTIKPDFTQMALRWKRILRDAQWHRDNVQQARGRAGGRNLPNTSITVGT